MNRFKAGDKIRFNKSITKLECQFRRQFADDQLVDGQIYTVVEDSGYNHVRIETPEGEQPTNAYNPDQFELVNDITKLPSKWSIKVTAENQPRLVEYAKEKKIDHLQYSLHGQYYHFNGDSRTSGYNKEKDFVILTIEDLDRIFMKETKKQIGWLFNSNYSKYEKAAQQIAFPGIPDSSWTMNSTYNFTSGSIVAERLKDAGVLEEWFLPVYKEEKKPVTIVAGGNNISITISKTIVAEGVEVNPDDLLEVVKAYRGFNFSVGSWTTFLQLADTERVIKIGCSKFSVRELENILGEHNKWNK